MEAEQTGRPNRPWGSRAADRAVSQGSGAPSQHVLADLHTQWMTIARGDGMKVVGGELESWRCCEIGSALRSQSAAARQAVGRDTGPECGVAIGRGGAASTS